MVRKKRMSRVLFPKERNSSTRKARLLMHLARLLLFLLTPPVLPELLPALPPRPLMQLGSRSLLWSRALRKALMHLKRRWVCSRRRKVLLPRVLLPELALWAPRVLQLPWLFPLRLLLVRLPGLPLTPCVARL